MTENQSDKQPKLSQLWRDARDWIARRRLNHAAKQPACLTHCGKVKTLPEKILHFLKEATLELATIALGAVFIWFNILYFFLQAGSVDVSFLRPNVQSFVAERFNGRRADVGDVDINWHRDEQALGLRVTDGRVKSRSREDIADFALLDLRFDLGSLAVGKPVLRSAVIEGGAITVSRDTNSELSIRLGSPESNIQMPRVGDTRNTDQPRKIPPRVQRQWTAFDRAQIKGATVYLVDEINGINWRIEDTSLEFEAATNILTGLVPERGSGSPLVDENKPSSASQYTPAQPFTASLSGQLLSADNLVPLSVVVNSDKRLDQLDLSFEFDGFSPAQLLTEQSELGVLTRLDAPIKASAQIAASRSSGLEKADIVFSAGRGFLNSPRQRISFESADFNSKYNVKNQSLEIESFSVLSSLFSATGRAELSNIGAPQSGFLDDPIGINLVANRIKIPAFSSLPQDIEMSRLDVIATADLINREMSISSLDARLPGFDTQMKGEFLWDEDTSRPNYLFAEGKVTGDITPQIILQYWPKDFADGARRWIDRSLPAGRIPNIDFVADIDAEDFAGGGLENEDLSVRFSFSDADVRYVSTMTPMNNVRGQAELQGNRFDLTVDYATIGSQLRVEKGTVEIPRLFPKGGDFTVTVNGAGPLRDLLRLIDEPPFELAKKANINPDEFSGSGNIAFQLNRPLLENFDRSLVRYSAQGQFAGVSAPFSFDKHKVTGGAISLDLTKERLEIKGPISIGPWPAQLEFYDAFDGDVAPTTIRVSGPMTRDDLDRLGIGFREFIDGTFFVDVTASHLPGQRADLQTSGDVAPQRFRDAKLNVNLNDAVLSIGEVWKKPAGQPASLTAAILRSPQRTDINDIAVTAPGMRLTGEVQLAADLRLEQARFDQVEIDRLISGRLAVANSQATGLSLALDAVQLDISPWARDMFRPRDGNDSLPISIATKINQLTLSPRITLSDFSGDVEITSRGLKSAELTGTYANSLAFLSLVPRAENTPGNRQLTLTLPEAGIWLSDIYDIRNVQRGELTFSGNVSPTGAPFQLEGEVKLTDFGLVNIPAFAQILSLASLEGLADALSGQGMRFAEFTAPLTFSEGIIQVENARMGGSSIGLTANGSIDFEGRDIDINGVLVPSYTINSMLGDIPLLGDIVVGKKGEGIFALSYTVKGDFDKSQIAVNPLSAFTPGFLRRIFDPVREEPQPPKSPNQQADGLEAEPPQETEQSPQ